MPAAAVAKVKSPMKTPTGIIGFDEITGGACHWPMGTLRSQKERAERVANEVAEVAGKLKRVSLDAEEAVLEVRAKSVQTELVAKPVEKTLLAHTTKSRDGELSRSLNRVRELRGGDHRTGARQK